MAKNFLEPTGIVAVISELQERPSPVFRWLSADEEREATERHLLKSAHPQSLAAIEIYRALSKHSIYMMSRLPGELLEEYGIGAIADIQELEHLVSSHDSTLVISGAQHRHISRL